MIYHVPTIVTQAVLLEHPARPELSPPDTAKVVKVRRERPNFHCSRSGRRFSCVSPAREVHRSTPLNYGRQPKGIEGFDEPSGQIEDMADFYARAIAQF